MLYRHTFCLKRIGNSVILGLFNYFWREDDMHPLLLQAEAEAADAFRRAKAGLQMEKDLARAALMAGDPPPPSASSARTRALRPATEPAPSQFRVPTDAEREASRLASFSKLSASDQALLARFGAAPFSPVGVAPSALPAPAQPALSDYDHGQLEAARLLGKSAPALAGARARTGRSRSAL
jgi:hypothetical protein